MRLNKYILLISLIGWLLSACGAPVGEGPELALQVETAVAQTLVASNTALPPSETPPTAIPEIPLTLCLGEQTGLTFIPSITAPSVLAVLQPEGVVEKDYDWQAGSLVDIPSFENGHVRVETVSVQVGDFVLNNENQPVALQGGVYVRPAGCRSGNCAVPFDSRAGLEMEQIQVTFEIRADLFWQSGDPLIAQNSVDAFVLAQAETEAQNTHVARTASYTKADEFMTSWVGIPGYLPQDYANHFWHPVPSHVQTDVERTMLSYGLYRLLGEATADKVELTVRPEYSEAVYYTKLIFKRLALAQWSFDLLETGACDVLDETISTALWNGRLPTGISRQIMGGNAWDGLHFGIVPQSYDDIYSQPGGDRPNYFGDERVRNALAMCIDREAIAATVGVSDVLEQYIAPTHPAANATAGQLPAYNLQAALTLLAGTGWQMGDDDVLVAKNILGIQDGTRFSINYFTLDDERSLAVAKMIVADLQACGVETALSAGSAETLFATGETGLLFGRNFDLAQFAWQFSPDHAPACDLYYSDAIPGGDLAIFPYGWGGWNLTGWQNELFDEACQAGQDALPGEADYLPAHGQAQTIFAEQLPSLPLFVHENFYFVREGLCGIATGVTPFSVNLATWYACNE